MIRAAVIGAGAMGANHARVYSELENATLVAVSDINPDAKKIAEKYDAAFYTDYKEMLDKEKPDAVSICVPTTLHFPIAKDTLSAGIHTLVEKPITETTGHAQQLIELAKSKNLKLMVGHIERFNPVVKEIKDKIKGEKILSINIHRVGPQPPRVKDVGIIMDLGTHDIDLSSYITNSKVKKLFCSAQNTDAHEDSAMIILGLEGDIPISITTNWLTPYKLREVEVVTEKRLLKADLIGQVIKEYTKSTSKENTSYDWNEDTLPYQEPLKLELESFISSVEQDTEPEITGEDGLNVLKIALLCIESAKKKEILNAD